MCQLCPVSQSDSICLYEIGDSQHPPKTPDTEPIRSLSDQLPLGPDLADGLSGAEHDDHGSIEAGAPQFSARTWDLGDGNLADRVAIASHLFSWTLPSNVFTDSDAGDQLTYSATLLNGEPLPSWLQFDSSTRTFSGIPPSSDIGEIEIKVIATDTTDETADVKFQLSIQAGVPITSTIMAPGGVTTDLELWLSADQGVVETDGAVSAWLDQSGNQFQSTQGISNFQPHLKTDGLNGRSTLSFNRDFLETGFQSELNSDEMTVFIVNSVTGGHGQWRSPLSSRDDTQQTGYNFHASRYNNPNWQFWTGNDGAWNTANSGSTLVTNEWGLISANYDGTQQNLYVDGKQAASRTNTYVPNTTAPFLIGAASLSQYVPNHSFSGDIAEVLVYSRALDAVERNRVDSYLSTKYGLSLDQSVPTNYVSSNGTVWWDAVAAGQYKHNIAGIVRDHGNNFIQTQSSSSHLDGIVTVALEDPSQLGDGEFFFWSDDGASAQIDDLVTVDLPSGYAARLSRVWQVNEATDVGQTTVSFDLTGLGYSILSSTATAFALLIDDEGTDFSNAIAYTQGRSLADQTVSFTDLNLSDGQYFSLAATQVANAAPTGTDNTLTLDEDTSHQFSVADFGFNDVDGDDLAQILITRLPKHGVLQLEGVEVEVNQAIALSDLTNLTFTPNANQFGQNYTNFAFRVNDGQANSLEDNQLTLTVNPVTDPEEIPWTQDSDVDDGSVIDVMIVYTQGALDQAGSLATLESEMTRAVIETNDALAKSGVHFQINLIQTKLVEDYVGVDTGTDLGRVNNGNDGYMDEVHDWRNQYSADIVSLWTTGGGYGHGYQPGSYHTVTYGSRYNFDHELGHNLGAAHDHLNGGNTTTAVAGYRDLFERFSTIGSYGGTGISWIQRFSNPDLIQNDIAYGSEEANNVKRMNGLGLTSANRRHSNDNLANAHLISGATVTSRALNSNATLETDEVSPGGKTVWWKWTAPSDTPVQITTAGSDFDTTLGVYLGSNYADLATITTDKDSGINDTSQLTFNPIAGQAYHFAVGGDWSNGRAASGQIQLNLSTVPVALPSVSLTVLDAEASEATLDTASFRLTRDSSQDDLEVNFSVSGAKFNHDYQLTVDGVELSTHQVTIPDGQTSVDVLVTPLDDQSVEVGGETLQIQIESDFTTYALASFPQDRGVIQLLEDHDAPPAGLAENLQFWIKADSEIKTTETGAVTQLRDLSPNSFDVAPSNSAAQPTLVTDQINGQSVLRFDGNDILETASQLSANFVKDEASVFVVTKTTSNPSNNFLFTLDPVDYGRFLAHLPWSGNTAFDFGNASAGRVSTPWNQAQSTQFSTWGFQAGFEGQAILNNGAVLVSDSTIATPSPTGRKFQVGRAFQGEIAEFILFNQTLSDRDRLKVDSYLALKYGFTLDQSTPTDYLSSDGTQWWNASQSVGYDHGIAGIAQDDAAGFEHTQSHSSETDSILTVQVEDAVNGLEDGESLTWGHNNAAINIVEDPELPSTPRLQRIWKVQENHGDVGALTLRFDLSALGLDLDGENWAIAIASDTNFNTPIFHTTGYRIDGNVVTFTGLNLQNGDVFTLIQNYHPGLKVGSDLRDTLVGEQTPNNLYGKDGNDLLYSNISPDNLDGGNGIDVAVYTASKEAIVINLETGYATGGYATGDTLTSTRSFIYCRVKSS